MFDIIAKFESTIRVKAIDKNFEDMMCYAGQGVLSPTLFILIHMM